MEFNIADAKRKERMGMTKDAIAAATAAQRDKKDAGTAQLNKLKAIGDIQSKVATANRPIRIGGGAGNKPTTQAEGVNQYFDYYKEMYPENTVAQNKKLALDTYLEKKGAGLPGVQAKIEATAEEKARERAAKAKSSDVKYQEFLRKKDTAGADARYKEIIKDELNKENSSNAAPKLKWDPKSGSFVSR
jgi:hypothetical protein